MTITIKKTRDYNPMPMGSGSGKWHGFAFNAGKRIGTVWKFPEYYVYNEDFNRAIHSRDNRPKQFKGRTLAILKKEISEGI